MKAITLLALVPSYLWLLDHAAQINDGVLFVAYLALVGAAIHVATSKGGNRA